MLPTLLTMSDGGARILVKTMDKSNFRISRSKMKFVIALVILSIILVAYTQLFTSQPTPPPIGSVSGTVKPTPRAITLPPQGLYDSCLPESADCVDHLNILAAKGFTLILNYSQLYSNSATQIAYADRAQSLGMKVIWCVQYRENRSDNWMVDRFTELATESQCTDNNCLLRYFINLVKDHPATWGYYVADEVPTTEYARMKEWTDLIKELDPDHPRLFVTQSSNDPMEQYYRFHSYMADLVDVFGPDYYPYGYIESGRNITRFTGDTANHAQYWADKLNKESALVLQAFSQVRYAEGPLCIPWPLCAPFPSYEQMKAQRDQAILNSNPAIILWWTYADILETEDPMRHLDDLAAAAFAPLPTAAPLPEIPKDNCPPGWNCEDIGNPALKGTQTTNEGTWIVQGSGWDIWTELWVKADQFRYVWQPLTRDFGFSTRVVSQTSPNFSAKSGLMIRKSFDPVSPYYAVFVTPGTGVHVQYRPDYGQKSRELAFVFQTAPVYIQVMKIGTTYKAYISDDSKNWELISNSTVTVESLNEELMVGFGVTSHAEDAVNIATFDHVTLDLVVP